MVVLTMLPEDENPCDLKEAAKAILDRLHGAVFVPFRQVGMSEPGKPDWLPNPKYCHDNVAAWVSQSPQHKRITGYLVFDTRQVLGVWQVVAHSVVQLEDGTLIDITPSEVSRPYPFVPHVGSEEEFVEMAMAMIVCVPVDEWPR